MTKTRRLKLRHKIEWPLNVGPRPFHVAPDLAVVDPFFKFSHTSGTWEALYLFSIPVQVLGNVGAHPDGMVYETSGVGGSGARPRGNRPRGASLRALPEAQDGFGSYRWEDGTGRAILGVVGPAGGRVDHPDVFASNTYPSPVRFPLVDEGNVYARSFRPSATDLASLASVAEPVTAGDVLVIDPETPGELSIARMPTDTAVFGIVTGEPVPGTILGKALDSLDAGTGLIKVVVMLR